MAGKAARWGAVLVTRTIVRSVKRTGIKSGCTTWHMQRVRVGIHFGVALVIVGIIVGGRYLIRNQATELGTVVVPEFSSDGKTGEMVFLTYCTDCHGMNAAGSEKGPPLVTQIYAPYHHGDFSFVRAVTLGVPQHHWLFGVMPAQSQIARQDIDRIIIYIRELQRANGIK